MTLLVEAFSVVLATTWRAGLLIALYLALRLCARGRISKHVWHVGWILVAIRLLIPFGIPTAWSPYNLARPLHLPVPIETPTTERAAEQPREAIFMTEPVSRHARDALSPVESVATVWLIGLIALSMGRIGVQWAFRRRLRQTAQPAGERIQAMVNRCARELGAPPTIRAVTTTAVTVPALYGSRRPMVLFPPGVAERLTDDELRLVVLHEMGHWRRRDLFAQTLLHYALILHWFNPLVWLAVRLARHDCELACDEFVLRRGTPDMARKYGATLIKLVDTAVTGALPRPVLGLFTGKRQLRHRIRTVRAYRPTIQPPALAGGLLLAALTLVGITHECLAQDVVASITPGVPLGWTKGCRFDARFDTGADPTQSFLQPESVYLKAIEGGTESFAHLTQLISAEAYRGKRLRVSGWIKTVQVQQGAFIYVQINESDFHGVQFDDMRMHPIRGTVDWTSASVVLDVPPEADTIHLGFFFLGGAGQAWLNDLRIETVGLDVPSTNVASGRPKRCTNPDCLVRHHQASGPLPTAPVNTRFAVNAPR